MAKAQYAAAGGQNWLQIAVTKVPEHLVGGGAKSIALSEETWTWPGPRTKGPPQRGCQSLPTLSAEIRRARSPDLDRWRYVNLYRRDAFSARLGLRFANAVICVHVYTNVC